MLKTTADYLCKELKRWTEEFIRAEAREEEFLKGLEQLRELRAFFRDMMLKTADQLDEPEFKCFVEKCLMNLEKVDLASGKVVDA